MIRSTSASVMALQLGNVYTQNKLDLNNSLLRLVSGKRIREPSDDITAYLRGQTMQAQYQSYSSVKDNLSVWVSNLSTAKDTADLMNSHLTRMKELVNLSNQTTDAALQDGYNTEFQQLAQDIKDTRETSLINGYSMLTGGSPVATLSLDDTGSNVVAINLPDVINEATGNNITDLINSNISSTGNTVTALAHVNNATTDMQTYMGTVAGYQRSVQAHVNLADSIMQNSLSAESDLTGGNEAQELITYTTLNMRQQMTMAMLAQSNMSQGNLAQLFGFGLKQ